jgi:hypothetical protein
MVILNAMSVDPEIVRIRGCTEIRREAAIAILKTLFAQLGTTY